MTNPASQLPNILRPHRGAVSAVLFCIYCLTFHEWIPGFLQKFSGEDSRIGMFIGLGLGFLVMAEGVALFNLLPRIYAERSESTLGKAWYRRGILIPLAHLVIGIIIAINIANSVGTKRLGEYRDYIYGVFIGIIALKEIILWGYILVREFDEVKDLQRLREKYANDLPTELTVLYDAILLTCACLMFTLVWQPYIMITTVMDRRGDALEPGGWQVFENTFLFLLYYMPALLVFVFSDWLTLKSRVGKLWFWGALALATFGGTFRSYAWPAMPDEAHLNAPDASGTVPIARFARYAPTSRVEALLGRHADVNAVGPNGTTALMASIASRRLNIFEKLIAAGANVNARDAAGRTAAHLLTDCFLGSAQFIEKLKSKNADFDLGDNDGLTPAMLAVTKPCGDTPEILIAAQKNPDIRDINGKTLLMLVARHENKNYAKLVAGKGACVNCQDNEGNTALHLVLLRNKTDPDFVQLLLQLGADPRIRNKAGQSCIDLATPKNKPKSRKMMLASRGPYRK